MFRSFLNLFAGGLRNSRPRASAPRNRLVRPQVEDMEERLALSTTAMPVNDGAIPTDQYHFIIEGGRTTVESRSFSWGESTSFSWGETGVRAMGWDV